MSGPNWNLDDDLKTVTVTFPSNPPVALQLDAAAIDDLLKNLGAFRASMLPPHDLSFTLGQKVMAIPNPAWVTEPDALLGDSLLHLRDPRFGWQHYVISRSDARKLGILLQKQADTPPSTRESTERH